MRTKYFFNLLILPCILLLNSCATIFNGSETRVHVHSNMPAIITVPGDSSTGKVTIFDFLAKRSVRPIVIKAYSDTVVKTVTIKARNSAAYNLNLLSCFPLGLAGLAGFVIDRKNPKRYTYPDNIYLDLTNSDSNYESEKPLAEKYQKYKYILCLTPLKMMDISNPAIMLTAEKKLNKSFSGDIMFGYLLPGYKSMAGGVKPKAQGITTGLQLKWFPHQSAPQGFYTAVGFEFLESRYHAAAGFYHALPDSAPLPSYYDYADTFTVHKQTYTINAMIGYQKVFKRFFIDVYGGLGVRFKDVAHTGRMFPGDAYNSYRREWIDVNYYKNRQGVYSTVSVPLNIRIGWTF